MQLVFYSMIQFTMQLIRRNGGCPPLLKEMRWGDVKKTPAIEARALLLNDELKLLNLERVFNRVF